MDGKTSNRSFSALELKTLLGTRVEVELNGGRQGLLSVFGISPLNLLVWGILRGIDALNNLVLDGATENGTACYPYFFPEVHLDV
jgi:small nuclear ribonucleoprotein (snRNP)-like protein